MTTRPHAVRPAAFLRSRPGAEPADVLVCVGDSFTQGTMSANYVDLLAGRLAAYRIVKAGVDAELAWNVLQRLDEVIACRPTAVTLLVGSNDVVGGADATWARKYRVQQRIPQTPTLDWYVDCVGAILHRLRAETDARIAVLDLPMLGEDLGSELNGRVEQHNAALRQVAAAHDVPCLPLHERLVALVPPGHRAPPFAMSASAMFSGFGQHVVLRRSWSDIGHRRGLAVLTDNVHLAEPAARVVADLIAEWVASSATDGSVPVDGAPATG